MIRSFRHKGLKRLFLSGETRGVNPAHSRKLALILFRLDMASRVEDLNLSGLQLHQLRGDRAGTWSVRVSGNWRVTFAFQGRHVIDVDYEDYH